MTRVLLMFMVCHVALLGEDTTSSATASVIIETNANSAAIGDHIEVNLVLRRPRSWEILGAPDPVQLFDDEFVMDLAPKSESADGNDLLTQWALKLVAQRSGLWELPTATATLKTEDGRTLTISSPLVVINVPTPGGDSLEDLTEPELPQASPLMRLADAPEEERPFNWWIPLTAGSGIVILAALAWVLWKPKAKPPTPAEDIFAEELVGIPSLGETKAMGAALSAALRRYAGGVYVFDGLGSTHRETEAQLKEHLPAEDLRRMAHLLRKIDDLRWTPEAPAATLLKPLIDGARDWVKDDVKRRAEEAAAEAEHAAG